MAVASKPLVITAVLFIATVVTGGVGYAYYHSYTSLVGSLSGKHTLEGVLSRVSRLEYRVESVNGSTWIVEVTVNHANKTVTTKMMDANGTVIAEYIVGYSGDTITSAFRVDPKTGNRAGVDIASIEGPFRTSIRILRTPTGEVGLEPFPGVGPLYALYTIGSALSIDWKGQSSPFASVRWTVASYKLQGATLKAVLVSVTVNPTLAPVSEYNSLHALRAVAAEEDGIVFFPMITYSAGTSELSLRVTALTPAS
jgi:hypothetical protein